MISVSPGETRIAKFENGRLTDVAFERERSEGDVTVGDIVYGKVTRVDPSINLAFVDIGTERNAVLIGYDAEPLGDGGGEDNGRGRRGRPRIERLVEEGQSLVLGVSAEAMDNKGAKLTAKVTLPGQHLVFITYRDEIVFSRQITDDSERDRLREALEPVLPEKGGFILRTGAVDLEPEALRAEAQGLVDKWANLNARAKAEGAPALLQKEETGPIRALRDHLSGKIDHIVIDDGDLVATAKTYAKENAPDLLDAIEHYKADIPLFEEYEIEGDIERLMSSRVPLKGGGWIVIEETEALTAIDVNSGRRRVQGGKEAMALDTNLAAVKEIAKQVRLRGLGGAFVIDLIQMREEKNMIKVEDALEAAMKGDPLPHRVGEISDFGLLEMTRKRANKPLARTLMERCRPCYGRGARLSVETVGLDLIRRAGLERPSGELTLYANDEVAAWIEGPGAIYLDAVKAKLGVAVTVSVDPEFSREKTDLDHAGRQSADADDGEDSDSDDEGDDDEGSEDE
jgi:ribonuclease G